MKSGKRSLVALLAASFLAACGGGPADVPTFSIPVDAYYPESLTITSDGTLLVGSLGTGQVVKFAPGATTHSTFVAPGGDLKNASGVFADDAGGLLYVCSVNLADLSAPPSVRTYDLKSGAAKGNYPFPASAFCNDFGLDGTGNLYATDSFGKIYKLAKGGTQLELWNSDPLLAPSQSGGFGADGIVFDGKGNLYVNTYSDARLLKIPIKADGTAGPVTQIQVGTQLALLDGMRLLDANTLVVVEGVGKLTKLSLSGTSATATQLAGNLDTPTGVVKFGNYYYVSEGQLDHLFGYDSNPPTKPFSLKRIAAN
jgi:sugar lactone lactonase YvrE